MTTQPDPQPIPVPDYIAERVRRQEIAAAEHDKLYRGKWVTMHRNGLTFDELTGL